MRACLALENGKISLWHSFDRHRIHPPHHADCRETPLTQH
jgi:hypothetical protein